MYLDSPVPVAMPGGTLYEREELARKVSMEATPDDLRSIKLPSPAPTACWNLSQLT